MASSVAIAMKREQAVNAIQIAAIELSKLLGVAEPVIPVHGRDLALLQAQQLEAVAAWLKGVVAVVDASTPAMPDAQVLQQALDQANEKLAQYAAEVERLTFAGQNQKKK